MSKTRNHVGSEKLRVTTTPEVLAYLEEVVRTGIYGKNQAEAADRLIARGIEELVRAGLIPRLLRRKRGQRRVAMRRNR